MINSEKRACRLISRIIEKRTQVKAKLFGDMHQSTTRSRRGFDGFVHFFTGVEKMIDNETVVMFLLEKLDKPEETCESSYGIKVGVLVEKLVAAGIDLANIYENYEDFVPLLTLSNVKEICGTDIGNITINLYTLTIFGNLGAEVMLKKLTNNKLTNIDIIQPKTHKNSQENEEKVLKKLKGLYKDPIEIISSSTYICHNCANEKILSTNPSGSNIRAHLHSKKHLHTPKKRKRTTGKEDHLRSRVKSVLVYPSRPNISFSKIPAESEDEINVHSGKAKGLERVYSSEY